MSPPASSTIVRTALRVVPAPRSGRARILTVAALVTALASAGRRLWLAGAARRFAAVRGLRFERPVVALLPPVANGPVAPGRSASGPTSPGSAGPGTAARVADATDASTGGAS